MRKAKKYTFFIMHKIEQDKKNLFEILKKMAVENIDKKLTFQTITLSNYEQNSPKVLKNWFLI